MALKGDKEFTISEGLMIFTPIVIVVILVSLVFKFENTSVEDFRKYVIPSSYNGFVVEKYKFTFDHGAEMIKCNDKEIEFEIYAGNWHRLYGLSEIGDSLYKIKGEKVIHLKKKDGTVIDLEYFFSTNKRLVKRKKIGWYRDLW